MKKNNTEKGYCLDLSVCEICGHKIQVKNCKKQIGHDDSIPYTATLYIDGKRVCTLYQDGWGGETNITQISNSTLLEAINKEIKGQPYPIYPWDEKDSIFANLRVNSVVDIVDYLAEGIICLNKCCSKYGRKNTIVAFKGELVKSYGVRGSVTQKLINDCKAKCEELIKSGWIIVNSPHFYYTE